MYIINISQEVLNKIDIKIRNMKTYDFSTLYPSIPHKKLLKEIKEVIDRTFEGMRKPFIYVSNFLKARWCNKKRSTAGGHYIDATALMNMITWLVKNTFVIVGNKIYQQVIGIPMGTDGAPFLANLFLFSYDSDLGITN